MKMDLRMDSKMDFQNGLKTAKWTSFLSLINVTYLIIIHYGLQRAGRYILHIYLKSNEMTDTRKM